MASSAFVRKLKTILMSSQPLNCGNKMPWCSLDQFSPKRATFGEVLLFVSVVLLDCFVFLVILLCKPLHMASGSQLLDNGVPAILLIATTGSVVKLCHIFAQRGRIPKVASSLLSFDKTIQRLDFRMRCGEVNYWATGWVITFYIATILLSVAAGMFGSKVFDQTNTIVLIAFIDFANIPFIVFLVWYLICELGVWCRLKLLCKLVENGAHLTTSTAKKDIVMLHQLIAAIAELQNELSTIVRHINALFLVQVFMCLAAYTSLLIFTLFSYYRAAVVMGETEYSFAWLTIAWTIYNSLFVLPSILFGAWIRIESHRFTKLVHRILRRTNDVTVQDQLLTLSQQLHHRPLGTRVCFVSMNWPAYASILGYIITYVVILIQFDSKAMEITKLNRPTL